VSEEQTSFIFWAEEWAKQAVSKNPAILLIRAIKTRMGGDCNTHGMKVKCIKILAGSHGRKRPIGRHGR
jgi:hypothetical protein